MMSMKILFVTDSPVQLHIKHVMKTSSPAHSRQIIPSLFQIAASLDDFVTVVSKAARANQSPFSELMSHPEKLEAALKIAKSQNDAFDLTRRFGQGSDKRPLQNTAPKNFDGGNIGKYSNHSTIELKATEFHLEAPFAGSVKLAADFTDWEQFPLDMIKSEDGIWHTSVPLPPGTYSYRFIVDGEWCDDPQAIFRLHENPFGPANAVVDVIG
jgi:hypothetical protein